LTFLKLFLSFFKIGLFSFGGGYAMIPLIQKEIETNGWLTHRQFIDIIAVSQVTPGPIAVNSATFVGYKVAGLGGALISTIGVALPTFILAVILSKIVKNAAQNPILQGMLHGVRPVVLSLISLAAVYVANEVLFSSAQYLGIEWASVLLIVISFFAVIKFKVHPILLIFLAGFAGLLVY